MQKYIIRVWMKIGLNYLETRWDCSSLFSLFWKPGYASHYIPWPQFLFIKMEQINFQMSICTSPFIETKVNIAYLYHSTVVLRSQLVHVELCAAAARQPGSWPADMVSATKAKHNTKLTIPNSTLQATSL